MIRAIRFATKLSTEGRQFRIVPESLESISRNRERLAILSKERITEELNKILVCEKPSIGFRLLDDTGLLEYIMPQLTRLKGVETVEGKGHKENFSHTLEVTDNVAAYESLMTMDKTRYNYEFVEGQETAQPRTEHYRWLRWAALMHALANTSTTR